MVKKISACVLYFLSLAVSILNSSMNQSDKARKDIHSLDDLNTEISRARETYKNNKHVIWEDVVRRGNRIDREPMVQSHTKTPDQQTK